MALRPKSIVSHFQSTKLELCLLSLSIWMCTKTNYNTSMILDKSRGVRMYVCMHGKFYVQIIFTVNLERFLFLPPEGKGKRLMMSPSLKALPYDNNGHLFLLILLLPVVHNPK